MPSKSKAPEGPAPGSTEGDSSQRTDSPPFQQPRENTPTAGGGAGHVDLNSRVTLDRYFIFLGLALAGCAIDLATKSWVFGWLSYGPKHWIIEPYFGFQKALNTGGLFGMASGQVLWLAALSGIALIGVTYWLFIAGAARDRLLTIALGIVVGGILGNLYDRLGLSGETAKVNGEELNAVRDWILFEFGSFTWPNFNIADTLLVCGAGLLVWHALRKPPIEQPRVTSKQPSE